MSPCPKAILPRPSSQASPARLLSDAGLLSDDWQAELLRHPSMRTLLLCSRQSGKSTVAAALSLRTALLESSSLVLLLSPSLRQSESSQFQVNAIVVHDALDDPAAAQDVALHVMDAEIFKDVFTGPALAADFSHRLVLGRRGLARSNTAHRSSAPQRAVATSGHRW
jgi:hypothetical protein